MISLAVSFDRCCVNAPLSCEFEGGGLGSQEFQQLH